MSSEENIKNELIQRFPYLENRIRVQRERRIFMEIENEKFSEVFDFAVKNLGFSILCTITGLDEVTHYGFIYHLANPKGITLNIKSILAKEHPVLRSITPYFPGAHIYERELIDLLGVKVDGLPDGKRYPLPDNWPEGQYPLRKDWKIENLKEEK